MRTPRLREQAADGHEIHTVGRAVAAGIRALPPRLRLDVPNEIHEAQRRPPGTVMNSRSRVGTAG
jgi:hypothetical protein